MHSILEGMEARGGSLGKRPHQKVPSQPTEPQIVDSMGAQQSEGAMPVKRRRSEPEKEAAREQVAQQRAAEQMRQRIDSGHPMPVLQPGM